eukprot:CAMPEP_0197040424 /NCGR_PEP_ID=MMETSP1384-20130603/17116_1 /TAXON_ID=29189 /ORGANISM="Ammonia sp." /LENGTH=601 /DNA_ID=CAMNT_0042471173 /DNA_START=43 /DNA_END=1848 /DNA_ORIENTATION=-
MSDLDKEADETTKLNEDEDVQNGELVAHAASRNKQIDIDEEDDDEEEEEAQYAGDREHDQERSGQFDPGDDPMHVDFNEDSWMPCIPICNKVSLTLATMIAAVLGIAVGLAISLAPPHTISVQTTETLTRNITYSEINNTTNIDNIVETKIIGGQLVLFYETTINVTSEVPYVRLDPTSNWYAVVEFFGQIWINALKLLVLPLITMMMVVLPSRVEAIGPLGKICIPLYLLTSTCAAIQGTCWAWIIQPGNVGKAESGAIAGTSGDSGSATAILITDAIFNVFYNAVPPNIIVAMSDLTVLGIIVFFLAIGILLRHERIPVEEQASVIRVSQAILRCTMKLVVWVVWYTPIGMFFLICLKVASTVDLIGLLGALGFYLLCVVVGHSVHTFVFYPVLFWLTTRLNGWKYYLKIFPAALLAFGTSSSAATLPRSLQVAESAGVRKEVYSFIIPLGAAINMDGTALGFPIMIGLIAQINDVPLDFGKIFVVMILSVVISIGTAPIPNVGMVYLTMLFEAAGIGEYAGEGIATLFVLDWLVDRIETAVNVTSDQYVAKMTDVIEDRRRAAKGKKLPCCWWCTGPTADSSSRSNGGYEPATEMQMR